VNAVAVSRTIRPVTHTALVEVKTALTKEIPLVVALGSISMAVPKTIRNKKLKIIRVAGFWAGFSSSMLLLDASIRNTSTKAAKTNILLEK
jgi:hypothetical protein